jgi:hypothetical protein
MRGSISLPTGFRLCRLSTAAPRGLALPELSSCQRLLRELFRVSAAMGRSHLGGSAYDTKAEPRATNSTRSRMPMTTEPSRVRLDLVRGRWRRPPPGTRRTAYTSPSGNSRTLAIVDGLTRCTGYALGLSAFEPCGRHLGDLAIRGWQRRRAEISRASLTLLQRPRSHHLTAAVPPRHET